MPLNVIDVVLRLEQTINSRNPGAIVGLVNTVSFCVDSMETDPRFEQLLRRVGVLRE